MSRTFLEKVCARRHLVLHMDINKTIIQTDNAGGRSLDDVLNSNAASNVYGRVNSSCQTWTPVYGPREAAPSVTNEADRMQMMSYDAYVDLLHGEPPGMQSLPYDERRAVWREVTGRRRTAVRSFTSPGAVGEAYHGLVEEQRKKMLVNEQTGELHSIIPSFFELLNYLSELNWPFTLIFRTFGTDVAAVLVEWRRFLVGQHHCKPRGAILDAMRQRIEAEQSFRFPTACIFRREESLFIFYGPSSLQTVQEAVAAQCAVHRGRALLEGLRQCCKSLPGCTGVEEVCFTTLPQRLLSYFAADGVGGLVDYYEHWASVGERRCGGKVFPVFVHPPPPPSPDTRPTDGGNAGPDAAFCYNVFFDDNIFIADPRSIVDIRDARSGASICDAAIEHRYCVPVNAYRAIVEDDYFIDELAKCLGLQQQQQQCTVEHRKD